MLYMSSESTLSIFARCYSKCGHIRCHLLCLVGEGNGTPLQYFCLENPIDGGAWLATVHGVAKSRTRLSNFTIIITNSELDT